MVPKQYQPLGPYIGSPAQVLIFWWNLASEKGAKPERTITRGSVGTVGWGAPVLEEALQGPAHSIALRWREQVLQLLTEGPPLYTDAGRQNVSHPLQCCKR